MRQRTCSAVFHLPSEFTCRHGCRLNAQSVQDVAQVQAAAACSQHHASQPANVLPHMRPTGQTHLDRLVSTAARGRCPLAQRAHRDLPGGGKIRVGCVLGWNASVEAARQARVMAAGTCGSSTAHLPIMRHTGTAMPKLLMGTGGAVASSTSAVDTLRQPLTLRCRSAGQRLIGQQP